MNIELPLETWANMLGFLPRPYLGGIVSRIGSRQLATIIQFVLHKYGAVKLGDLRIECDEYERAVVRKQNEWGPAEPIDPDCAVPKNIKDFDILRLSYFDNTVVLPWLQKLSRHHLFNNLHLHLQNGSRIVHLYTLLPLLESIESVRVQDHHVLAQICATEEQAGNSMAASWLAHARILQICVVGRIPLNFEDMLAAPVHIDRVCQWLYMPIEHSSGPRVLFCSFLGNAYVKCLMERVEKDFIDADQESGGVSYFIRFQVCFPQISVDTKSLRNERTKEKFSIKDTADTGWVLISRLPAQSNPGWIAEKEREVLEWDYSKKSRRIELTN